MTAAWTLEYTQTSIKWLKKADPQIARRVRNALRAVVELDDPRQRGKALTGPLAGLWRYRVGDYRIVCDLGDERLVVLVIEVEHRSSVYD